MTTGAQSEPADFTAAVQSLHGASIRGELEVGSIRPPQRLAPYSYALGVEVAPPDVTDPSLVPADSAGSAFGRLVLLYDPSGQEAWNGTFRLVAFIQAEVEADLANDPLLPEVAWEWLTEALGVPSGSTESLPPLGSDTPAVVALGGTVTATTSVRYGDIAGPPRAHQLELRASWTPTSSALAGHLEAFCEVLASAAGLPPAGTSSLGRPNLR
ncbi:MULTISPECIES: DUF3000 domain-containing protein [unclassified Gordonia (in: high G+C Gram-positive bacteria)]|uniref:DUF3000 domain-containing protein n=1 Tax=unclassified Gordonia (in: high G+C Gram-positive bacteria) TaxID=2657482 RepID=UPI001FFF1464|nr:MULTISPECIES: DUF3000 domain-containing protein [unclassified Gordonia (in: high G+C Gram-positive bacteria)]UQE73277.1 DUF3000 domain-containing protein [Gordonia sp. PP30]